MEEKEYIYGRIGGVLNKIKVTDIKYIKALGDYVNIYTEEKRFTLHITLLKIEKKLKEILPGKFCRVHRSYIISLDHLTEISIVTVHIGLLENKSILIGKVYKKEFLKCIDIINERKERCKKQ